MHAADDPHARRAHRIGRRYHRRWIGRLAPIVMDRVDHQLQSRVDDRAGSSVSRSRSSMSSMDPLMSAKRVVTVLRSPSSADVEFSLPRLVQAREQKFPLSSKWRQSQTSTTSRIRHRTLLRVCSQSRTLCSSAQAAIAIDCRTESPRVFRCAPLAADARARKARRIGFFYHRVSGGASALPAN